MIWSGQKGRVQWHSRRTGAVSQQSNCHKVSLLGSDIGLINKKGSLRLTFLLIFVSYVLETITGLYCDTKAVVGQTTVAICEDRVIGLQIGDI